MATVSTSTRSVQDVLKQIGAHQLTLVVDEHDAAQLEQSPGNQYSLADALGLAIVALITNERGSPENGHDAPLGLLLADPSAHGLPNYAKVVQASAKMRDYLVTDPEAVIALLTPTTIQHAPYQFTPEYGESLADNWVFRIALPTTLDVLIWAVVDKTGKQAPYCYCIE